MRHVRHALMLIGFIAAVAGGITPAFAEAGHKGRFIFRCAWVDPYDSLAYTARLEPGMAVIAAPGSKMTWGIEIEDGDQGQQMRIIGVTQNAAFAQNGGRIASRNGHGEIAFDLPDAGGTFPISLTFRYPPDAPAETATLVIVVPKQVRIQRGRIQGYIVGSYPARGDDRRPPDRFVEVSTDMMDLPLSRHFRIRDFVSNSRTPHQQLFFPKYAVIRNSLIQKVEKLVALIDRSPHFQCKGIRVLSGFRTPDYNHVLPESAEHSYHQYGLAADIIVDSAPADGVFDDVNQDGKINIKDAAALAQICDHLEKAGAIAAGGIGLYEHRHSVGGGKWYSTWHVHVDIRESRKTRWGYAFKDGRKYARIVWN